LTFISEYPKLIGGCRNEIKDKKVEQTNWAPEHSEVLRELVARGLSYSEIANAINAKFKSSIPLCNPNNFAGNELPVP